MPYSFPIPAGARLFTANPVSARIVTRYGKAVQASGGILAPNTELPCHTICSAEQTPKPMQARAAGIGRQPPRISAASAMNPLPAVISSDELPGVAHDGCAGQAAEDPGEQQPPQTHASRVDAHLARLVGVASHGHEPQAASRPSRVRPHENRGGEGDYVERVERQEGRGSDAIRIREPLAKEVGCPKRDRIDRHAADDGVDPKALRHQPMDDAQRDAACHAKRQAGIGVVESDRAEGSHAGGNEHFAFERDVHHAAPLAEVPADGRQN